MTYRTVFEYCVLKLIYLGTYFLLCSRPIMALFINRKKGSGEMKCSTFSLVCSLSVCMKYFGSAGEQLD